jgi:hypothetical protein
MKCSKCGAEIKDGSSFCTACGARQDEEPIKAQVAETNNAQPEQLTDADQIWNKLFETFNSPLRMTEDLYRNKMVRNLAIFYICTIPIIISMIFFMYRGYKMYGFVGVILVLFTYIFAATAVEWICKFNFEEDIERYDAIVKKDGQRKAILYIESREPEKKIRRIAVCILFLVALVLDYFRK